MITIFGTDVAARDVEPGYVTVQGVVLTKTMYEAAVYLEHPFGMTAVALPNEPVTVFGKVTDDALLAIVKATQVMKR